MVQDTDKVSRMRALAARLRAEAADTEIGLYQRKLLGLAADLEEAATVAESRTAWQAGITKPRRKGNGHGCGH